MLGIICIRLTNYEWKFDFWPKTKSSGQFLEMGFFSEPPVIQGSKQILNRGTKLEEVQLLSKFSGLQADSANKHERIWWWIEPLETFCRIWCWKESKTRILPDFHFTYSHRDQMPLSKKKFVRNFEEKTKRFFPLEENAIFFQRQISKKRKIKKYTREVSRQEKAIC